MRLTFLGTRGNIEEKSRLHRRHSALLVETDAGRSLFDCGGDWSGRLDQIAPDVIFVTHAHPDHADALKRGAPCPVYASTEAWRLMAGYPIKHKRSIGTDRPVRIAGLSVRAFSAVHSLRAPAVAYRVTADGAVFLYAPDIIDIVDHDRALAGVQLYIGDGASPTRPLVRRHDSTLFGHTTIRAQIGWCAKAGIAESVFTHCGAQIVRADPRKMNAEIRGMGEAAGVHARLARDGLVLDLP